MGVVSNVLMTIPYLECSGRIYVSFHYFRVSFYSISSVRTGSYTQQPLDFVVDMVV